MSDHKTIAKNTAFLYMRMLLMVVIAFFTSRILLKELGVSDFGLYGLIGGIVAMFNSLRGIFASSIQRFLNFEMGMGNKNELAKIFSTGVIIHAIVSLLFLLIAETLGLWFLNSRLVIDQERITAANWVFQFSILASILTIMTIPYDAVIIANERMKAFAYISILDVLMKLAIIFLISTFNGDNLVLYAFLIVFVSFITRTVSMIYCTRNFEESKFKFLWDKTLLRKIGHFAGWNFLGNTAFTISNEGVNMLLNVFGGTPVNAARAIAYQVRSITTQFTSNIILAVNPHLIKLYSQDKKETFINQLFFISKVTFFVMFILCVPIIFFTNIILTLWLVNVPQYTVVFVKLILVFLMIRIFHNPIDTLFKATGKIKTFQIVETITLLFNLPVSYLCLKYGYGFQSVFVVMIVIEVINLVAILYLAQKMGEINISSYVAKVIIPCVIVSCVAILLSYLLINPDKSNPIIFQLTNFAGTIIITIISILLFGFRKKEKRIMLNFILNFKNRFV